VNFCLQEKLSRGGQKGNEASQHVQCSASARSSWPRFLPRCTARRHGSS
jgi:hypothetical protein